MSNGQPLQQFACGRRCTHVGCSALLSRYNPSTTCGVHDGWIDEVARSFG